MAHAWDCESDRERRSPGGLAQPEPETRTTAARPFWARIRAQTGPSQAKHNTLAGARPESPSPAVTTVTAHFTNLSRRPKFQIAKLGEPRKLKLTVRGPARGWAREPCVTRGQARLGAISTVPPHFEWPLPRRARPVGARRQSDDSELAQPAGHCNRLFTCNCACDKHTMWHDRTGRSCHVPLER